MFLYIIGHQVIRESAQVIRESADVVAEIIRESTQVISEYADAAGKVIRESAKVIRCILRRIDDQVVQVTQIIIENQVELMESKDLTICGYLKSLERFDLIFEGFNPRGVFGRHRLKCVVRDDRIELKAGC